MPSQKTAETKKLIKCEVIRAIGIDATPETLDAMSKRASSKNLKFVSTGLTTMIYPSKKVRSKDGKSMVPGEKVFIDLEVEVARKLQECGAVRAVI